MNPIALLASFLVAASLLPAPAAALERTQPLQTRPGGTFTDDNSSLHQSAIEAVAQAGITKGCDPPANTRFCPYEPVTRGQMAAFLTRALDLQSTSHTFSDTQDHVFSQDIAALAEAGVARGCNPPENTRFCPDDSVKRGEIAAFLARALGLSAGAAAFIDTADSVFQADIAALADAGITRGCNPPENTRFCPDQLVTRAEMASFLDRGLGLTQIEVPAAPHQITVQPRHVWNARPARTSGLIPHTVHTVTIHHDGSPGTTFGPNRIAGYQAWHMDHHGWPDIAYHFIVGRDGTVYAGRNPAFQGDSATTYDLTGHLLIVLEGHLDHYPPTQDQLDALETMMAWASQTYGVAPEEMIGHRHRAAGTSCPGANLSPLIENGTLARSADRILAAGGVELSHP